MTSASTFPSLPALAQEDTMEMSSPGNRYLDDDIDIDFDDTYDGIQLTDDEHMLEDNEHTRPGTATDDMMQDDELAHNAPVAEELMHDDPVPESQPDNDDDDELIDYDDEEYLQDHSAADEESAQNGDEQPQQDLSHSLTDVEQVDLEKAQAAGELSTSEASKRSPLTGADGIDAPSSEEKHTVIAKNRSSYEVVEDPVADDKESQRPKGQTPLADPTGPTTEDDANILHPGEPAAGPDEPSAEKPAEGPGQIDTSLSLEADGPPTPTDTGLHPMILQWRGQSMPLFKSRMQPGGLLKDDNLVSVSIADFLTNCRERLALKLGETVSQDEDLILAFSPLGLKISEDSQVCFAMSLNDVLEVYLDLHHNEGNEDIPPLLITLSLQPRFNSLFNFLKSSAAQGQGISVVMKPQYTAATDEVYDEEDGDLDNYDAGTDGVGNADDTYEGHDGLPHSGVDPAGDGEEELQLELSDDERDYDGEEYLHDEDHEDADQDYDAEADTVYDAGEEAEQAEDAAQYDDPDEGAGYATEHFDSHEHNPTAPNEQNEADFEADVVTDAEATQSAAQVAHRLQSQEAAAGTAERSTNVRHDANTLTGEYLDDDLIDFDSDGLTYGRSEPDAATDHNVPSTPTATKPNGHDRVPSTTEALAKRGSKALVSPGKTDGDHEAFQVEPESFPTEGEFEHYEDVEDDGEQYAQSDSNDIEKAAEEQDLDYQTEEANNEDQGVDLHLEEIEDEDQFHTAFDLLADEDDDGQTYTDPGPATGKGSGKQQPEAKDEDTIDFDDDDDDLAPAPEPIPSPKDSAVTNARAAKRWLDDDADPHDSTAEHEAKRARAA